MNKLRFFLVTAAILVISIVVVRSCFFKKQSFNPDTAPVTFHTNTSGNDTLPMPAMIPHPTSNPGVGWVDELIKKYINESDNELIRATLNDTVPIKWLFDRTEDADTATYFVYNIGHDVTDEDGKRFITDAWVYIDTLTHQLYEYDLANDRLVKWKK